MHIIQVSVRKNTQNFHKTLLVLSGFMYQSHVLTFTPNWILNVGSTKRNSFALPKRIVAFNSSDFTKTHN